MSKKLVIFFVLSSLLIQNNVSAQFKPKTENLETVEGKFVEKSDSSEAPLVISLDQALQIALSENISVRVADQEIKKADYAKKGTYSSLFPQVSGSGAFQRTIKKQVMYFDMDMDSMIPGGGKPGGNDQPGGEAEWFYKLGFATC